MNKRYALTMDINGRVSTEYTELKQEERFNRNNFKKHIAQLLDLSLDCIEVLNVKRI